MLSELPAKIRKRIPVQVTDPARLRALEDTKQAMKGVEQQEDSECMHGGALLGVGVGVGGWGAGHWWLAGEGVERGGGGVGGAGCVYSRHLGVSRPAAPPHGFHCPPCDPTHEFAHLPWLPQWGF